MEKRKNDKGIVLQRGERQLPDGRYRYRYSSPDGKTHDVYSWRLRPQDPVPEGKKPGPSLRDLEKDINRNLENGIMTWKADMKMSELVEKYLLSRENTLTPASSSNLWSKYNVYIKKSLLGKKKVKNITPVDIEAFYRNILDSHALKVSSLFALQNIIQPSFNMAIKERIILQNPAIGVYPAIKKEYKNVESVQPKIRHAISQTQLDSFLTFVKNNKRYSKYYDMFYLLAWTGCRINELLSLSWYDIDFEKEIILIRRSISVKKVDGKRVFYLKQPKSKSGIRSIPMLQDTKAILEKMKKESKVTIMPQQKAPELSVKDTVPFIFINRNGHLFDARFIAHVSNKILELYNQSYDEQIDELTPHVFRHCFTCWLIENLEKENPSAAVKAVQSILGHADASTTLNIYAELRKEAQESVFEMLKEKASR